MLRRGSTLLSYRALANPCPDPETNFLLGEKTFPYYIAPVPGNRFAFLEHDGVSDGYLQGFRPKKIHWLYRWRHNLNPRCRAVGFGNDNNPQAIQLHWLENKLTTKAAVALFSDDGYPHLVLWTAIVLFTIWHIGRYLIFHPDISLWSFSTAFGRPFTQYVRFTKLHPMDVPVFRWFQGQNEFYMIHHYREYVKRGFVANDPWVEKCKEDGIFDELTKYPTELRGRVWPPKKEQTHH